MDLHQGDCIQLQPDALGVAEPQAPAGAPGQLYQVIGVDQRGNRCWLRRWPLARHGSPVFEVSLQQIEGGAAHRPLPPGRHEG